MRRKLMIVDWKSSKAIYDEYRIQLAAYYGTYLLDYAISGQGPDGVGILRLDKETGLPEFVDCTEGVDNRWAAFLALREYFRLMEEPKWHTKSNKKCYSWEGKEFPSVTTILGILDKPPLVQWAANMVSEYFVDNLMEIRNSRTTPERIEYILKKAKTAHRTIGKKAMDIGIVVHDAIECYLSGGKPEEILEGNDRATNSFLAFLEWKDKINLEPIFLEKPLICPEHQFGGTCDFIGWMDT